MRVFFFNVTDIFKFNAHTLVDDQTIVSLANERYLFLKNFWLHWVFVAVCGLFVAAHRSSLVAVQGLLLAAASPVAEHASRVPGLSSCGTRA